MSSSSFEVVLCFYYYLSCRTFTYYLSSIRYLILRTPWTPALSLRTIQLFVISGILPLHSQYSHGISRNYCKLLYTTLLRIIRMSDFNPVHQ